MKILALLLVDFFQKDLNSLNMCHGQSMVNLPRKGDGRP